ncbi:jg16118 [Pararge aegeria aegeria]|uniref:Jg16118 protein n=1 Tax=Pararge aegeria aegeria TaxID=348720 RepID=A0A8S4REG8_9NEOP|nr:jg16118 [Pararge aegeria aegeria]
MAKREQGKSRLVVHQIDPTECPFREFRDNELSPEFWGMVEHQWENFVATIQPEGWRARYHIYSPGLKPGGGQQHRPTLSKNGCYLVRLFYLGAWRCVWVSDLVPVDATDSPLLPFSPLVCQAPKSGTKPAATVTSSYVHLWPLLLCKALLKLAAPDMSSDEDISFEDEPMMEFDILHALTGALNITYTFDDTESLWKFITSEVPLFFWDDDDDTITSTVKSKNTKKQTTKETAVVRVCNNINNKSLLAKSFDQHLKKLSLGCWIKGRIQKAVVLETARIVRRFLTLEP